MNSKKSFVLYTDLIHTVRKMKREKRGDLFLTILEYVNDENPVIKDEIIDLVFEPIKQQLKRDLQNWLKTCERNTKNGKKGGRPKNPIKPKKPNGLSGNPIKPKKPDNDNDNDTDNDNDNDNDSDTVIKSETENLWIRTFGRMPKIPEIEVTERIIKRFGYDKTYTIMKDATLKNFKSILTLEKALNNDGVIMSKDEQKKPIRQYD